MSIPIKNSHEIEKMRLSCRAASDVLERTGALVQPGVTTGEIDRAAASFMREASAKSAFLNYRGFPGNICISVNDEVVHGIGGSRRIQYGDIVKLDIGVVFNGWVGDTATTIPVGVIEPAVQRLLQVTEDTLHMAIGYATETETILVTTGNTSKAGDAGLVRLQSTLLPTSPTSQPRPT